MTDMDFQVESVFAYPLRSAFLESQRTGAAKFDAAEAVVVEVRSKSGHSGWGEGLCRRGAEGFASIVSQVLSPAVLLRDCRDHRGLWRAMRGTLSGRLGGQLVEAMSAIDIALWDLHGKILGQPICRMLPGTFRPTIRAYASSINWVDDARVEQEVASALAAGFKTMKVKIGLPVSAAVRRVEKVREIVGNDVNLLVDANCVYSFGDAVKVGRALERNGYEFFEEPIVPNDRTGYRLLSEKLDVPLAAGEGDFVAVEALEKFADRSIGLVQPDVARSGGITETWRIIEAAALHGVAYAPHVGWSGAICAAASMQLAAAAENFHMFECMVPANPLRDRLATPLAWEASNLVDGQLTVPLSPGLGIEVDLAVLDQLRVRTL